MELAVKDPLVGLILGGRYQMLARIARGGMATVYRALDQRLDREVAVKVMHPHLADSPQFLTRFQAEARAAARLTHPAVVAVADQGVDEAGAWLAMELLPGRTVRDELAERGRFTLAETAAVMECVLGGIGAAHDAGIIHRDIKPENILATGAPLGGPHPAYKVSDFGLARALGGGGSLTQSVLGTPAYIAPEQARDGRVDTRVDIYSAGIVLFELLTGRQPFTAESPVQVILAHIGRDVPPVSRAIGPAFGDQADEVDSLVAWACARDPQLRPNRAADLLDEMRMVWRGFDAAALHARHSAGPIDDTDLRGAVGVVATPSPTRWFDEIGRGSHPTGELLSTAGPNSTAGPSSTAEPRVVDLRRPIEHVTMALPRDQVAGVVGVTSTPLIPHSPATWDAWSPDQSGPVTTVDGAPVAEPGEVHDSRRRFEVSRGATRRRSEQTLGIVLLAAMIASLAVAGLVWWSQVGPGAYTPTPAVAGMTADEATGVLDDAGLAVATEPVFSDTVPEGSVISSDPGADERVRKNGEVTLRVSGGPELIAVPAVVGMTLADATAALVGAGLADPQTADAFDDAVALGNVISADPAPGTPADRETPVRLSVSKGPEPRTVPSVVGLTRDSAESDIAAAGLSLGTVTEQNDPSVAAGIVLSQAPDVATLPPGGAIDLVVSSGPPQIPVPSVVNLPPGEAISVLEALGFVVERRGTSFLDRVWQQYPEAETPAAPGTTVLITTF